MATLELHGDESDDPGIDKLFPSNRADDGESKEEAASFLLEAWGLFIKVWRKILIQLFAFPLRV